jgi:hypothetical protein
MVACSLALAGCSSGSTKAASTTPAAPKGPNPVNYVYTRGPETSTFKADTSVAGLAYPNDPTAAIFLQFDNCLGTKVGLASQAARGAEFASPDSTVTVDSGAEIVTPTQLAAHTKELSDPRIDHCVLQMMNEASTSSGSGGSASATDLTRRGVPVPPGATARLAYSAKVTEGGLTLTVYLDAVYFTAGRVESEVQVGSIGKPADDLVTAVAAQMTKKIGQQ